MVAKMLERREMETTAVYQKSDIGNAQMFADRYSDRLRYVHGQGIWLWWDGTRWKPDTTMQVVRFAKDCVRTMYHQADNGLRISEADAKWALQCQNRDKVNSMIEFAKSELAFMVLPEQLDTDPYLVNCLNCTVDLRTGKSRPHSKDDLITRRIECDYTPGALAPIWTNFLWDVLGGDADLIQFVCRALGYSLSGAIKEHAVFFLFGHGGNGKSTFIETVTNVLGEYSAQLMTKTLMQKDGSDNVANSDIAGLQGRRICFAEETEKGRRMDEALVKKLTGGDKVRARLLYGEPFTFVPTHKLWMFGNYKPIIRGTDRGIRRRIKLIPFNKLIADSKMDTDLPNKLAGEMSGILNTILAGARDWDRHGLGSCKAVDTATAEYFAEMDIFAQWIEDEMDVGADKWILASGLRQNMEEFYKGQGERAMSERTVALELKARGFVQGRLPNGARIWKGLQLKKGDAPF